MIPSYILLALLCMFMIGIAHFVYSRAVRKGISVGTMTCSQASFFLPVITLWACLEGTYIWTLPALLGPVASLLMFSGIWSFMRSVSLGEASVSTPIGQLSFVVSALMATLWMKERFTKRKTAGLLLAVATIAAFMLS